MTRHKVSKSTRGQRDKWEIGCIGQCPTFPDGVNDGTAHDVRKHDAKGDDDGYGNLEKTSTSVKAVLPFTHAFLKWVSRFDRPMLTMTTDLVYWHALINYNYNYVCKHYVII